MELSTEAHLTAYPGRGESSEVFLPKIEAQLRARRANLAGETGRAAEIHGYRVRRVLLGNVPELLQVVWVPHTGASPQAGHQVAPVLSTRQLAREAEQRRCRVVSAG